jgi:hypothetical protein
MVLSKIQEILEKRNSRNSSKNSTNFGEKKFKKFLQKFNKFWRKEIQGISPKIQQINNTSKSFEVVAQKRS